eukprot:m.245574 g.245574  ORF g.245574 m.245574 type:complete len:346 (+) comp19052_c0_seq25:676-1713(+)
MRWRASRERKSWHWPRKCSGTPLATASSPGIAGGGWAAVWQRSCAWPPKVGGLAGGGPSGMLAVCVSTSIDSMAWGNSVPAPPIGTTAWDGSVPAPPVGATSIGAMAWGTDGGNTVPAQAIGTTAWGPDGSVPAPPVGDASVGSWSTICAGTKHRVDGVKKALKNRARGEGGTHVNIQMVQHLERTLPRHGLVGLRHHWLDARWLWLQRWRPRLHRPWRLQAPVEIHVEIHVEIRHVGVNGCLRLGEPLRGLREGKGLLAGRWSGSTSRSEGWGKGLPGLLSPGGPRGCGDCGCLGLKPCAPAHLQPRGHYPRDRPGCCASPCHHHSLGTGPLCCKWQRAALLVW